MPWSSVRANIQYWNASHAWVYHPLFIPGEFHSTVDTSVIENGLENLYSNSTTMNSLLDAMTAGGAKINIGKSDDRGPMAVRHADSLGNDNYILLDPQKLLHSINSYGEVFILDHRLIIAHEISHVWLGTEDLPNYTNGGQPSDADLNMDGYDNKGGGLLFEEMIASQLGLVNATRVSYQAGLFASDTRLPEVNFAVSLRHGSVTGGHVVDIGRLGDRFGYGPNDIIDISARTDDKQSLLAFGFSGDDYLRGGSGTNHLFGGSGIDTLIGGSGVDYLFGGSDGDDLFGMGGDDWIYGDEGADVINGGEDHDTLSYEHSQLGVTIDLRQRVLQSSQDAIAGLKTNGVDTDATDDRITGIEVIIGSDHDDVFYGDGTGVHFVGGGGKDTFYLFAGDSAEGGAGVDKFYLSSTMAGPNTPINPNRSNNVTINGLDPEDEVYIDGIRHYGNHVTIEARPFIQTSMGYTWHTSDDEGFLWFYDVEATSRFVPDFSILRNGGSSYVYYGGVPKEMFSWNNVPAFDNFFWTGEQSGSIVIMASDVSWDSEGYLEQPELTNLLRIDLTSFAKGDAGISYNGFNADYHIDPIYTMDDNHRWHDDPSGPYEGSKGPYNPAIIYYDMDDVAFPQTSGMFNELAYPLFG